MNETLLQLAGRLHPVVLPLPIGVLVGLVAVELWGSLRGRPLERGARLVLVWLLVATAGASVASGILLSAEPAYADDAMVLHKWLGIVTGAALLVAAAFATIGFERGYLGVLLTAGVLIIPAGYLGFDLTHGPGFLGAPPAGGVTASSFDRGVDRGADLGLDHGAGPAPSPGASRVEPIRRELRREAVADLHAAHVHAEIIDPESDGLWIDFTAVPQMPLEEVVRRLGPLASHTVELSLRGVAPANEVLIGCAPWERLERLDLSGATVDRDGLDAASAAGRLTEVSLIGATLTADAAAALTGLETLQVLHVWGSNLPAEHLATLRTRGTLVVNDGAIDAPAPVEIEPAFELGPPKVVAVSLEPVNAECPVTGAPVDARFSIVHDGQVVAFCCNVCPGRFWDDPSAFPVKAVASGAVEPIADEHDLFDGETLAGWHAIGGGAWSVEDGVIVGRSSQDVAEHGLLVSDGAYGDFEVTFEYRVFEGDSGFYFRAEEAEGALGVAGFQVEVDDVEPGGLYETAGRGWVVKPTPEEAEAWHRAGAWNAVELTAVGPELTVTINGTKTAQLDDPDGRAQGVFAFQLHGGQDMHVRYRNIRLRDR